MDEKEIRNVINQNLWTSTDTIHSDLLASNELVYTPCKFLCSQPILEEQNAEYGAYIFYLNSSYVRFRVAKITPTKVGQFVTLWERINGEAIQPYDISNPADLFVISTRKGNEFGQFIFPKTVLFHQGIVSNNGEDGKRAIRVYPPWDKPTSYQAKKTQIWQLEYFLEIPSNNSINLVRAKSLYGNE